MKPDDLFWAKMTHSVSELSNCIFMQVGAVIVKDYRILSFGYNGTAPDTENCRDHFSGGPEGYPTYQEFREAHRQWSDVHHIHAEQNAIMDALNRGQDCKGATLFCSFLPCTNCQKLILLAGITRVVYQNEYGTTTPALLEGRVIIERIPFDD